MKKTKTKPSLPLSQRFSLWWKKRQEKKKNQPYGWFMTLFLAALSVLGICLIWAVFVSGPARIHDEKIAQATEKINEQVPGIMGLDETVFNYITFQGYTADTLYWFDVTGEMITSRPMQTLNYTAAKEAALSSYGIETQTIQLAYGYTAPVYEIQSAEHMILLDYDTLALIYERRNLE